MNPARLAMVSCSPGLPDADYFAVMGSFARRHWWYTSRRALARDTLRRYGSSGGVAIDVGCGSGEMLETLSAFGPRLVVGTDLSPHAIDLAAGIGDVTPVVAAACEQLPFASRTMTHVTSMDVIEHLDDDVTALREYARVTAQGGTLLLTVPAYQWMWSDHDVVACHRRRYTARTLTRAVEAAGIEVVRTTYFHSFLVPAAFLLRRTPLRRLVRSSDEQTSYVHPSVNRVLSALARLEGRLTTRVRIPFGLSIMLVGRVPAVDAT